MKITHHRLIFVILLIEFAIAIKEQHTDKIKHKQLDQRNKHNKQFIKTSRGHHHHSLIKQHKHFITRHLPPGCNVVCGPQQNSTNTTTVVSNSTESSNQNSQPSNTNPAENDYEESGDDESSSDNDQNDNEIAVEITSLPPFYPDNGNEDDLAENSLLDLIILKNSNQSVGHLKGNFRKSVKHLKCGNKNKFNKEIKKTHH